MCWLRGHGVGGRHEVNAGDGDRRAADDAGHHGGRVGVLGGVDGHDLDVLQAGRSAAAAGAGGDL